jgi:hypothetical protein
MSKNVKGKWFENEEGGYFFWPDCSVPGCEKQACLRIESDKCYPHSFGYGFEQDRINEEKKEVYK